MQSNPVQDDLSNGILSFDSLMASKAVRISGQQPVEMIEGLMSAILSHEIKFALFKDDSQLKKA